MRLAIPGSLVLFSVALALLQLDCERATGFCQIDADCADGQVCSLANNTCHAPAVPDLAASPDLPPPLHLGLRVPNPLVSLPGDAFGYVVAATNTYAVFGSYLARGAQGAAYVADLTSTSCGIPVPLPPPDTPVAYDYFGISVAASGNTIAVGAHNKDGGKGAVYVYTKTGTVWSAPTKLVAADAVAGDLFGISVSLYGDTLAVGAYNKGPALGAAYVFTRTNLIWSPSVRLASPAESALVALDYFGQTVTAAPNAVAVAAPGRNANRGAVYLYKYDINKLGWPLATPSPYAAGSAATEQFGGALSLTPNLLAVGSAGYSPSAQNVGQGAVYLYNLVTPASPTILTAADPGPRQRFGFALSQVPAVGAVADTLLVGAPGREQAFVFRRSLPPTWSPTAVLDVSPDAAHAGFGSSVATTGTQHLIGLRGVPQDVGGAVFFPDN